MAQTIPDLRREAESWLKDTITTYMATTESGQPRVRPVSILWRDGAGWVASGTSNGKTQVREVSGGTGCCGQNMLPLYFGLGESAEADVEVLWTSGKKCVFENLSVADENDYTVNEIECNIKPS